MTRAKKAAWEEYPFSPTNVNNDVWDDNEEARAVYQRGYEQAEKHLIKKACQFLDDFLYDFWGCKTPKVNDFIENFKQAMEE